MSDSPQLKAMLEMPLRLLSANDIEAMLPFELATEVVKAAFVETSRRNVTLYDRAYYPLPDSDKRLGVMIGRLGTPPCFGVKLASIFHANAAAGLPSHIGLVLLFDDETGTPLCILEAHKLTAIRTAAASVCATEALAREDSTILAILGAGEQGMVHARALVNCRPFQAVHLWDIDAERAARAADILSHTMPVPVIALNDVESAVIDADVICTATRASEPILASCWVKNGTHINLVGATESTRREIDSELVARGRVFVDHSEITPIAAGELIAAKESGLITDDHIRGEIGSVLLGDLIGRSSLDDITLFKSVGLISQDLACAYRLWKIAEETGYGTSFEMTPTP